MKKMLVLLVAVFALGQVAPSVQAEPNSNARFSVALKKHGKHHRHSLVHKHHAHRHHKKIVIP